MMPAGPLMIEHRLIEKVIRLMHEELERIDREKKADVLFIDNAVDFIRTYADRCHHGKEEDILFRELGKKPLSHEHRTILDELIEEHIHARKTVKSLITAKEEYASGSQDALDNITGSIRELVEFYPKHIEKEDRHFFIPCMDYFSREEQDAMLDEFREFDRKLIHEKYRGIYEKMKNQKARSF
jgi:hemerythrin-like domain-containing protein